MILANMNLGDTVGVITSFILTLMVFSYILGDNVLFRLAIHIFIGIAAGYTASLVWYNVLWPQLFMPFFSGNRAQILLTVVPLLLSALLLTRISARLPAWGNPVMAYLVGAGVATMIGGAVMQTMIPQVMASINLADLQYLQGTPGNPYVHLTNGMIIVVGTLATLVYFHFGARTKANQITSRGLIIERIASVGQIFIAIALGAIFAGVYAAALTALISRLQFIVSFLLPLIMSR